MRRLEEAHVEPGPQLGHEEGALAGVAEHAGGRQVLPRVLVFFLGGGGGGGGGGGEVCVWIWVCPVGAVMWVGVGDGGGRDGSAGVVWVG